MAIGGPNNPLANLFIKNNATAGLAPKNQTEQVSSTEETSVDNTSKSAGRIAQLRAETLGDVFGTVGADAVAKTAGASSVASSAIKLDNTSGITATSALGEPSSVTAINNPVFGEIAASGNSETAFANQQLLLAAKMSQAGGISGDFQVSTANAELEKDNRLLASVG
ncbi:MAG: hypothetical protein ACOYK1_01285 [Vampirovibrionia bacterium]|nr:hypothetical protein [Pseudomonadota bacterium]